MVTVWGVVFNQVNIVFLFIKILNQLSWKLLLLESHSHKYFPPWDWHVIILLMWELAVNSELLKLTTYQYLLIIQYVFVLICKSYIHRYIYVCTHCLSTNVCHFSAHMTVVPVKVCLCLVLYPNNDYVLHNICTAWL